jgi:hypothetical protein
MRNAIHVSCECGGIRAMVKLRRLIIFALRGAARQFSGRKRQIVRGGPLPKGLARIQVFDLIEFRLREFLDCGVVVARTRECGTCLGHPVDNNLARIAFLDEKY